MDIDITVLNRAMCAYVEILPVPERLHRHITDEGMDRLRCEIVSELNAVMGTVGKHLRKSRSGLVWSAAFEENFAQVLRALHPWLGDVAIERVFAYSRWLAWKWRLLKAFPES